MPVTVKINPVEKVTTASILGKTLADRQKVAADYARAGLEDAKRIDASIIGHEPKYTVTVDGRASAPFESVNPDSGSIIIEFEQQALIGEVLQWIGKTLMERSPASSGSYRQGHMLLADGQQVAINEKIAPADEYTFINTVPYARKIEIGKTHAGRAFVIQVENRIYDRVARDARAKFGKKADIQFGYREMTGAYTLKKSTFSGHWKVGARGRSGLSKSHQAGAAVLSPAIIVRLKKS
jgi:hypothetical protein